MGITMSTHRTCLRSNGYLPHNGKHSSNPTLENPPRWLRSLNHRMVLLLPTFLIPQLAPPSLSNIARHNRIGHDAILVYKNTLMEDENAKTTA
ncbi:hypothetical protein FIBSPDRAFT_496297 [Athelia psychrophila]|uniref:Uncharacterized protein n=1 Tax=Athelia psychrophila TaxID=1759441 RepID=A0A166KKR6_9AGAM|nr:hypothetical protein FIBSPDRAFT_496297 [Fibularhizoctonia sp. CBS 109695]